MTKLIIWWERSGLIDAKQTWHTSNDTKIIAPVL